MRHLGSLLLCLWVLTGSVRAEEPAPKDAPAAEFQAKDLMRHVEWLAHPDRRGRGDWPSREASAAYIAKQFETMGLRPLPEQSSYFLDKPGKPDAEGKPTVAHRNVAGWIPGGEKPTEDYVILSAHYDHLGVQTKDGVTQVFAGADDNATGVAALIELARKFASLSRKLPRSIVFVAFDLEEQNLIGSQDYVKRTPLPLDGCAAFLTMDMLGRSLADLIPGSLFVMGTENSAALDALVRKQPEPTDGERIILGIDFQPGYSDYVPFKDAKIPYIFLTSGACADYHRATDVVARIQPEHLVARTTWVRRLVSELLELEQRPTWRGGAEPSVEEVKILQKTLTVVAKKLPDIPGIPPQAEPMVKNFLKFIDGVLADGAVTEQERRSVRNTTLMLFRFAQSAGGGR